MSAFAKFNLLLYRGWTLNIFLYFASSGSWSCRSQSLSSLKKIQNGVFSWKKFVAKWSISREFPRLSSSKSDNNEQPSKEKHVSLLLTNAVACFYKKLTFQMLVIKLLQNNDYFSYRYPVTQGTSVLGVSFNGGVALAADTLGNSF